MKKTVLLSIFLLFVLTVFGQKLPFQGKLIDQNGPVTSSGTTIVVALPDLSWTETHDNVPITDGLYFIVLGSIKPLPENIFGVATERQLTISINGTALSPVTLFKPLAGGPDGLNLKGVGNNNLIGGFATGSVQNENRPFISFRGNTADGPDRILMNVFYTDATNTVESSCIGMNSTDGQSSFLAPDNLTFLNNNKLMAQLLPQNWGNKGFSGYLTLNGPTSTNVQIGSKQWENADLPWFNMTGSNPNGLEWGNGLLDLSGEKYTNNGVEKERGSLKIHDDEGYHTTMHSREIMLLKTDWSPFLSMDSWGGCGNIELSGPNSKNITIGARSWEPGKGADRPIINLKGSSNQNVMELTCSNGDTNEEGIIRLNSENGKQANLYSGMFELRNSKNTAAILTNQNWGQGDFGMLELFGKQSRVRIVDENNVQTGSFETANWGKGNFGRLELQGINSDVTIKDKDGKFNVITETGTETDGSSGRMRFFGPNNADIIYIGGKYWENSGIPVIRLIGIDKDEKVAIYSNLDDDPVSPGNTEGGQIRIASNSGNQMIHSANGVWGNGPFNMWSAAVVYGNFHVNGDITYTGSSTQSSDQRLKKDIQPLGENVLGKIEALEGVSYFWRKDEFPQKNFSDDKQIGLIAQQLEVEFPALVKTNDDGFKSVNYNGFTAVLLQAVKELNSKVKQLESENQKLQAEVSASVSNRSEIDQLKSQMEILTKLVMEKSTETSDLGSKETASSTSLK